MKLFLALSMFGLVACVEPATGEVQDDTSAVSSSVTAAPEAATAPQDVTCTEEGICVRCNGTRNQNAVERVCSDGTRTIISRGPCGQDCL